MPFEDFILCATVSTLTEVLRDVYLMTGVFEDAGTGSDSTLSTCGCQGGDMERIHNRLIKMVPCE